MKVMEAIHRNTKGIEHCFLKVIPYYIKTNSVCVCMCVHLYECLVYFLLDIIFTIIKLNTKVILEILSEKLSVQIRKKKD